VAEARASVQTQPGAYLDETGWLEGRQRAWLWAAVTAWVTVFVIRLSRSSRLAQELLGERLWGYLLTDCWSAHTWYPTWRRQLCWAHLLRDIEAIIERGGRSREIGEALRAQAHQMFHWWHWVCDGTLARELCQGYAAHPARGGAVVGSAPDVWRPENRRDVSGDPQAAPGPVGVRPASRSRADQQCRRGAIR
jgi:Transposase IS66 family